MNTIQYCVIICVNHKNHKPLRITWVVTRREGKNKTVKLSIVLSVLFSIAIIIILLYFTISAETIQYLSTTPIRYEYFIAAAAVNLLCWGLWGARLKILSNAVDKSFNISLIESTKIVIANLFLANITPSMAGGEPVRIYLLNKDGLNIGGATAAVLGERLLDALFILITIPFAIFIFGGFITNIYFQIGLVISILMFLAFIGIFAYALKYPKNIKHFLIRLTIKIQRITKKDTPQHFIERISEEVDNFHNSMTFFLTKGKKTFLLAGIVTALFLIVGWTIPIFLLLGLGLEPFVLECCAAQVLIIIISMMPTTPGSSGVSEGGVAALYGVFMASSLVGVFVLLYRFVTYHIGLIVGAIFQYRIFKSVASFSMDMITSKK